MSDSTNDDLTEVILKLDEHLERPLWGTEFREFLTKVRSVLVAQRAAHLEACNLAESIYAQHYREDSPQWEVLPGARGVISQISNMVAGLTRVHTAELPPVPDLGTLIPVEIRRDLEGMFRDYARLAVRRYWTGS